MFDAVKGYPGSVDPSTASTMQDFLHGLARLQGSIRSIRALPLAQRMVQAKALAEKHGGPPVTPPVAIALVRSLRDAVFNKEDWQNIIEFIGRLPPSLTKQAEFREQLGLRAVQQWRRPWIGYRTRSPHWRFRPHARKARAARRPL